MSLVSYVKTIWKAGKSGGTPITPDNLNKIEDGIEAVTEDVIKLNAAVPHILSASFNSQIPSGADLDNYTTPGKYNTATTVIAQSVVNKPADVKDAFEIIVEYTLNNMFIKQKIITMYGKEYIRYYCGNAGWTEWDGFALNSNLNTISKKITGFYLGSGTTTHKLDMPSGAARVIFFYYLGSTGINGTKINAIEIRRSYDGSSVSMSVLNSNATTSVTATSTAGEDYITLDFSGIASGWIVGVILKIYG